MTLSHTLLAMAARSQVETGAAVPLAGRTRWTATLRVGAIDEAGSVTVIVEASPTGADESWTTLVTFGAQTATGTTTKASTTTPSPDFTIESWHRYLRARVTAMTGEATYEVTASAPFVTASVDTASFSKELRTFGDGLTRLVEGAEEDVLSALLRAERSGSGTGASYLDNPWRPSIVEADLATRERAADVISAVRVDIDLTLPGVGDAMRAAIVAQAEHRFRRHQLERDPSPTAQVSLRELPELVPGALGKLAAFRPQSATIWRGR